MADLFFPLQKITIPSPIFNHLTTNLTIKAYQKLIRINKKFFNLSGRLIVLKDLYILKENGTILEIQHSKPIIDSRVEAKKAKFWICGKLTFFYPIWLKYIIRCDITELNLAHDNLSFDNFKFLVNKVEILRLSNVRIFNSNQEKLTLGDIMAMIPRLATFA